ncbi:hypothetical protein, partial [Thermopetrobacter sp. TC1]|uniref:hypothetical protein n=1 Tax=Thermopetrobacter sp. TC1 TaxID=1495045 RepID=UPI001E29B5E2
MPERDCIPFLKRLGGVCYPAIPASGRVENPTERLGKDVQYPSGGKSLSPEDPFLTAITECVNRPWTAGTKPGCDAVGERNKTQLSPTPPP